FADGRFRERICEGAARLGRAGKTRSAAAKSRTRRKSSDRKSRSDQPARDRTGAGLAGCRRRRGDRTDCRGAGRFAGQTRAEEIASERIEENQGRSEGRENGTAHRENRNGGG